MRFSVLLVLILASCVPSSDKKLKSKTYKEIHDQAIFVDTHNDFLTKTMRFGFALDSNLKGQTHSDLKRFKQGGLDVQFFSVWSDGSQIDPYAFANKQIDSLDAVIKRNPDKIVKVADTEELLKSVSQHKMAALIGLEGGHQIENDLNNLDALYDRGTRYMTLTWNNSTDWATSAADETTKGGALNSEGKIGLTEFGRQIVQRMNELGMMIDVSHVGEQTFWDIINSTKKPIIASHSSVYSICPHPRNLNDEQIKAIAKNEGVVQINFYSGFVDGEFSKKNNAFLTDHKVEADSLRQLDMSEYQIEKFLYTKYPSEADALRAPLSLLIDHIAYIINLVGVDHVGIGSDFDGIVLPPKYLDDVAAYPMITKALVEKGYSRNDIDKILGGNLLRVLRANELKK